MATSFPTNTLYNKKTLFSLSGASVGVWLFTTVIASIFRVDIEYYKWIGLIIALVLSFVGAFDIKNKNIQQYTIIFFNGLLIYITACGIDSINHSTSTNNKTFKEASLIPFTQSKIWWKPADMKDKIVELEKLLLEQKAANSFLQKRIVNLEDSCLKSNEKEVELVDLNKKYCELLNENNNLKSQNYNLKIKDKSLENTKATNQSDYNIDFNFKINEYNSSMLNQTSKLTGSLLKKLNNFNSTGRYNPGNYSVSFLQTDIIEFQNYLEGCLLELDYLLKNK